MRPRTRTRLLTIVAVLVIAGYLGLAHLEKTARAKDTIFPTERRLLLRAEEAYTETFVWEGTFQRLPSPYSEPWIRLEGNLISHAEGWGPPSYTTHEGVTVSVRVLVNGANIGQSYAHAAISNGSGVGFSIPSPSELGSAWKYGTNHIRLETTVEQRARPRRDRLL